jgi:NAD(P)-dependent dehydrogenase (short-subunit alcohol dehydrogenase family)
MASRRGRVLSRRALALAALSCAAWLVTRTVLRRRRAFDFPGRVALVTGGSRGLGLVLARELAARGARVAICARDASELERARADLRERGAEVLARPCDVTQPGEVAALIEHVRDALGPVDVLINNAGVIQVGPLATMTLADHAAAMAVHFWGPLLTIAHVLPGMRARGEGRIVNIASIGGKLALPHLVPYSTSKFALVGLSHGLRSELLRHGIVVTTVAPGLMRTGSPRQASFKGNSRLEYAWFSIADSLPLLTLDAETAARRILRACRQGRAELVLSVPAKLAARATALAPELTAELLALVDRALPAGSGTASVPGRAATSWLSPSWLTALTDQAARRNNEM